MKKNIKTKEDIENYNKLKLIYFEIFLYYLEDKKRKTSIILIKVLNSKIFHLDRLLWIKVYESELIKKYLKVISIEDSIDSRDYLIYKLNNEVNSTNYLYLQKCLRIYK